MNNTPDVALEQSVFEEHKRIESANSGRVSLPQGPCQCEICERIRRQNDVAREAAEEIVKGVKRHFYCDTLLECHLKDAITLALADQQGRFRGCKLKLKNSKINYTQPQLKVEWTNFNMTNPWQNPQSRVKSQNFGNAHIGGELSDKKILKYAVKGHYGATLQASVLAQLKKQKEAKAHARAERQRQKKQVNNLLEDLGI